MKQAHSLYVTRHEEHDANHANHGPIDVVLAVHLVPPEKPPDQEAHRRLTEPQAHISKQKRSKHDTQSNESNKPDKNKPEHKNLLPLPAHSAPLRQACATCRIGRARIDHIPAVARRTSTRRVCTMPLCRTLTAVLGPRRPS